MSNFDNEKIVLPPPPSATKSKLKLKRVHTIPGSLTSNSSSSTSSSMNKRNIDGVIINDKDISENVAVIASAPLISEIIDSGFDDIASDIDRNIKSETSIKIDYPPINPMVIAPSVKSIDSMMASTSTKMDNTPNKSDDKMISSQVTINNDKFNRNDAKGFNVLENEEDDDTLDDIWALTDEQKIYYSKQFNQLMKNSMGNIPGSVAKVYFEKSGLQIKELSSIWKLSDLDRDGQLSLKEFCIAMHLVVMRRNGVDLPETLPIALQYLSIYDNDANSNPYSPIVSSLADDSLISDQLNSSEELINAIDFDENVMINNNNENDNFRRNSQKWTLFNDSPNSSLLLLKDEVGLEFSHSSPSAVSSPSFDCQSPTKLANFDYDLTSISSNPNICHPVPLRVSSASTLTTSPTTIISTNTVSNEEDYRFSLFSSSNRSNDSNESKENKNDINKRQPLFPVNPMTSDEILKKCLFIDNHDYHDINHGSSCDNLMSIIDKYVKHVEKRFYSMNPIKDSLSMTNNEENVEQMEELKTIIQNLNCNRRQLLQQNYQLYQDISNLLQIVNYFLQQANDVDKKNNSNDDQK